MHHPYQCLAVARKDSGHVLITALGPQVIAFDIKDGQVLSQWSPEQKSKDAAAVEEEKEEADSPSSTEIITGSNGASEGQPIRKKRKTNRTKSSGPAISTSTITKLAITSDYSHVIATTGEDKSVHVLSLDAAGELKHLSQRRMPKRPCAISLTPDDTHILCGDKFGDVYALPLHPPASDGNPKTSEETKSVPKVFKPAANELTIHSGRNRRALESQLKQGQSTKPKETIEFAHELLLGHVSMLTDLTCATIVSAPNKQRNYIITADRDEHIRVSRGMPQAHIIESFCLGHKAFISKICIPYPDLLVSGGGDDELHVWDWQRGRLLHKLDLRKAVTDFWETQPKHTRHDAKTEQFKADDEELMLQDSREAMGAPIEKDLESTLTAIEMATSNNPQLNTIAVSGLWAQKPSATGAAALAFYCALEGVPAVFRFTSLNMNTKRADEWSLETTSLPGNPLDVAVLADGSAVVAVDNIHEAGSTKVRRFTDNIPRLHRLHAESSQTASLDLINANGSLQVLEDKETAEEQQKRLEELFYSVENLRKRGGWGDQDAE